MQVALQQSATDPTTGTIDMSIITTGISTANRQAMRHLSDELLKLLISKLTSAHSKPAVSLAFRTNQ